MTSLPTDSDKTKAFCDLLHSLHDNQIRWFKDPRSPKQEKVSRLYREVVAQFRIISPERLRNLTMLAIKDGKGIQFGPAEVMILEPPSGKAILPFMRLEVDFQRPTLKAEVALFSFDSYGKRVALALRFETPEEKGDEHRYHHVQLCRHFKDSHQSLNIPSWIPDDFPAFPLSAKTPVSLFLAALMSLYGQKGLQRRLRDQKFQRGLWAALNELETGCGACGFN